MIRKGSGAACCYMTRQFELWHHQKCQKKSLVAPQKLGNWCRIYLTLVSDCPKTWQLLHRHHRWKNDNLHASAPGIDIELQEVVHWLHDSNTSSSSFSGVTKPLADPVNKNWKWLQEKSKEDFSKSMISKDSITSFQNSFRKKRALEVSYVWGKCQRPLKLMHWRARDFQLI